MSVITAPDGAAPDGAAPDGAAPDTGWLASLWPSGIVVRRAGSVVSQAGIATVALPMVLWIGTLAAIAAIDLGAYLTAAARAQALADAVALAAVSADHEDVHGAVPIREADRVAMAGGGQLVTCACPTGTGRAQVRVSVPVPGLVLPTLGASRVTAEAHAALVEPSW
jgi:hypothetical protein